MADNYHEFISLIKNKLGIDLNLYKEAQMRRRITSLRDKRGFNNFTAYYQVLERDDGLLEEFVDRMTINVSEFYRNPKRWDVLENKVFPHLIKNKKKLTIWSAACSTGEEPYSIAIMLREHFPRIEWRIIATDLDDKVLEVARKGHYKEQALRELPVELRDKYLTHNNGHYIIDTSLKE